MRQLNLLVRRSGGNCISIVPFSILNTSSWYSGIAATVLLYCDVMVVVITAHLYSQARVRSGLTLCSNDSPPPLPRTRGR